MVIVYTNSYLNNTEIFQVFMISTFFLNYNKITTAGREEIVII